MNLLSSRKRLRGWIVVLCAGLFVSSLQVVGQVKQEPAGGTKPSAKTQTQKKRRAASKSSRRRTRSRRRDSYRYRLARLHPDPQRIAQIQRALIQAGYLNQEATGQWDESTRQAMLRFQQEHGFSATGLPESKSLMKLGLGPHPLPEDADPRVPARASVAVPSKPVSPDDPPAGGESSPPATPQ